MWWIVFGCGFVIGIVFGYEAARPEEPKNRRLPQLGQFVMLGDQGEFVRFSSRTRRRS